MVKINKILIANRGEIALRIIRSAKEMGIKTVAVFSDPDRNAPFTRLSDEAIRIGPGPSKDSYLDQKKILESAKKLKVDAIHPGYGFLSENASFAKKTIQQGLIFIGPSPKTIRIMGDKIIAKSTVESFDVPIIPGSNGSMESKADTKKLVRKIGYPVLVKASAGGGGKGMRVVNEESELFSQIERAASEAKSSFGDSRVFIEKFISVPRHIEFQIMADQHGNYTHLFERECSIQRRHQKVIEEAPSSILNEELRTKMGKTAIDVARSCDYVGAGTVEFILDEKKDFYFLEMNTRLQVEHPVTEMITGIDLVKEQINIAQGMPLSFKQEDLKINGHAIESRVYAEDPRNNFLPDIGKLNTYKIPSGPGIRVDDSFEEGMEIPIFYDPMIAKLIAHGKDRTEAIFRMKRAIDEYLISGIETTLDFCRFVIEHPAFVSGNFDTNFVDKHYKGLSDKLTSQEKEMAAVAAVYHVRQTKQIQSIKAIGSSTNWRNRFYD